LVVAGATGEHIVAVAPDAAQDRPVDLQPRHHPDPARRQPPHTDARVPVVRFTSFDLELQQGNEVRGDSRRLDVDLSHPEARQGLLRNVRPPDAPVLPDVAPEVG